MGELEQAVLFLQPLIRGRVAPRMAAHLFALDITGLGTGPADGVPEPSAG